MIIENAILHIFDFSIDSNILSDVEIDLSDANVYEFIQKHLKNCINNTNVEKAIADKECMFINAIEECEEFVEYSKEIATKIYELLSKSNSRNSFDLLMLKYSEDEVEYIAILYLKHRPAFTRMIEQTEDGLANQMIKHNSIFVGTSSKVDNFALVNLDDYSLRFIEDKIEIDNEVSPIFSKHLFNCIKVTKPTKQILKEVDKLVEEVAIEYNTNPTIALTKAKNYINNKVEFEDEISAVELSAEVFEESSDMQEKFVSLAKEKEIPTKIEVDKKVVNKVAKNQKIKTDTGIEIIFPSEYSENREYIEFVNNYDGTISIQIKNIAKILNK